MPRSSKAPTTRSPLTISRKSTAGVALPAPSPISTPPPPSPSASSPPAPVARLTNSMTSIPKATYVPLQIPQKATSDTNAAGGAIQKFAYVSSLDLQPGEVDAVQSALAVVRSSNDSQSPVNSLLKQFEGTPLPSRLPSPAAFANVSNDDLLAFGNALVATRQRSLANTQPPPPATANAAGSGNLGAGQPGDAQLNRLNTALVNTKSFSSGAATSRIGMMNLERLEMTPAGIERGALIATIPLAPKERTCVVQQEWSVISQEFTSIVTDSLENYSETGVTDNTQLTQATQSQASHANQFNVNATVSGSIGFVSGSVATGFGSQDQNSQSAAVSRSDAIQTTRKASTRSTQSHKITISNSSTSGTSESSTRMLENPSATDPMRVDYFSLMRKWYVALYRYGLRLTYDITIPEPGAAMRETYAQLAVLQAQAVRVFTSPVQYSQVTVNNLSELQALADQYGAQLPAAPSNQVQHVPSQTAQTTNDPSNNYVISPLAVTFTIADGQQIDHVELNYNIGENHHAWNFTIVGFNQVFTETGATHNFEEWNVPNVPLPGFLVGAAGSVTITVVFQYANPAIVSFDVHTVPTPAAVQAWQSSVYSALYNAAQTAFYAQQQALGTQITALQNQISNVDTLTLRREENDEIMKCALRWLLGAKFEFMSQNIINLFKQQSGADIKYGIDFIGPDTNLSSSEWTVMKQHEDTINFINQAIDWDSVIYFLYSYFWDVPKSWNFIRQIQHPDSTRQAFLRAGSARIVLTVRKGWERAWTYFMEFGSTTLPSSLPSNPYLPIAQQIEDYDSTNYPGIPPANPDGGGPVDDDTPQAGTTCDQHLPPSTANVILTVADSTGFLAGATAIIDTWDSGAQETQTIVGVPDKTHITVQTLSNAHSPAQNQNLPYPIVQAGEKGVLIAEWFEYTPTSGVDIAVNSSLPTIA